MTKKPTFPKSHWLFEGAFCPLLDEQAKVLKAKPESIGKNIHLYSRHKLVATVGLRGVGAFDCPACTVRAMKRLIHNLGDDLANDL